MTKVLYIGDIMGEPGIESVQQILPEIRAKHKIDLVIAQAENVTNGKGMSVSDMESLSEMGVDFFTGGNHTPTLKELIPLLEDLNSPVIGPANYPLCPGRGWKYINIPEGRILIISLLGQTVGRVVETTNPLSVVDRILDENRSEERVATIVNFHGDYSSEKRVIGYYLDGRVTAVIGDHWHVPTTDAMILPRGTAHITDVGMCGSLHSSLGVKTEIIVSRWRDDIISRNELAGEKPFQFNAVLIKSNNSSGLADSIEQIQRMIN